MSQSPGATSLGIEQYAVIVARQWRVLLICTILGVIGAAGYLFITPQTTTATSDVNVNVISTEPFNAQKSAGSLLDVATEGRIATSHIVASQASEALGGTPGPSDIRTSSEVTTNSGTTIVRVSFTAGSRKAATTGADAVAAAYIKYRSAQAQDRIDVMLSNIKTRLTELRSDLEDAISRNSTSSPGSVQANQAESDRQQIALELEDLLSQKNTLESVDTTGGYVLTPATKNTVSVQPSRTIVLGTGLFAGLFLGLVLAFAVNPFDRTIRSAREMKRLTARPIFAVLPGYPLQIPARGYEADLLRVARERFFSSLPTDARSVVVIDDTAETDLSAAIVDFAIAAAQAEHKVVLALPDVTQHQLADIAETLLLHPLDGAEHLPNRYESKSLPAFSLDVPSDVDDISQSDPLITRQIRNAASAAPAGAIYLIVIKSEAHRSSTLAGLRVADGLLIIGRAGHSKSSVIRSILAEAEALGTPALGSLILGKA